MFYRKHPVLYSNHIGMACGRVEALIAITVLRRVSVLKNSSLSRC